MTKSTGRKKRNKLTIILMAPVFALIFIVGWSLYWIGQSRHQNTKQPKEPTDNIPTEKDEVKLIVIPQEEQMQTN